MEEARALDTLRLVASALGAALSSATRSVLSGAEPNRAPGSRFQTRLLVDVQRAVVGRFLRMDPEAARSIMDRGMPGRRGAGEIPRRKLQADGVAAEWLGGDDAPGPVFLYFHGGGYVLGSIESHLGLLAALCRQADARMLAANYRLAPENPFPAAPDDALRVYRWLLDEAGIDPARIVVAGDSAGGGLALALLQRLRKGGLPQPAAAALLCPWVDLDCHHPSLEANSETDYLQRDMLEVWSDQYRAGADPRHPEVSPLYADLQGLPPLLVQSGRLEVLADEIAAFCERAREAGLDLSERPYEGMFHDWQLLVGLLPEADAAVAEIAAFARGRIPDRSGEP